MLTSMCETLRQGWPHFPPFDDVSVSLGSYGLIMVRRFRTALAMTVAKEKVLKTKRIQST